MLVSEILRLLKKELVIDIKKIVPTIVFPFQEDVRRVVIVMDGPVTRDSQCSFRG